MPVLLCVLLWCPAGDGKVDYEEFLAATMHLGKLEREENLYRAFQVRWRPQLQRCQWRWLHCSRKTLTALLLPTVCLRVCITLLAPWEGIHP
jgi:hypothetical protein